MSELLCVTCPVIRNLGDKLPRRPRQGQCCDGCREWMTNALAELPTAYYAVSEYVEPGRVGGERRTKGFESRPPLNTHAVSVLEKGSVIPAKEGSRYPQDQLSIIPPFDLLWWWCEDWHTYRAQRETMPGTGVDLVVEWLTNRLDWACDNHPAIDDFATDLKDLAKALRAFKPRPTGEPAGSCPRKPSDARCGAKLYVDPYSDTITCPRCEATWSRKEGGWMHLRAQQLAAGVEAA